MPNIFRKLWSTTLDAFRTTPIEVLICIASAFVLSLAIEDFFGPEGGELVATLLMTGGLVGLSAFAASTARVLRIFDARTRWILTGCFGIAAVGYGVLVFDPDLATEVWRWAFLTTAAAAAVTLVPVASRLGDATASERFWRFNMRLLFRFSVAGTYALLLFAGVSMGLYAVEELFNLHISNDLYGHLFAWIVVAGGGVLAAGGLRDAARIDAGVSDDGILWGARLGTWLFLPLLTLYLLIMYVYLGQVVTGAAAPSNVLSPLALGAGIIGYLGLFVLHPVKERSGSRALTIALRAFPAAFIPLVPLGMWAVAERIQQYGWTEFRYARLAALVCLGVFSIVGAWKWARGREFSLVSGPAIVAAVALLSAIGPWGASNVSYLSQKHRLMEKLVENDALTAQGALRPPEELANKQSPYFSEFYYLLDTHGSASLADLTSLPLEERDNVHDQMALLGVADTGASQYMHVSRPYQAPFEVSDRGQLFEVSISENTTDTRIEGARFRLEGDIFEVRRGGTVAEVNLTERLPASRDGRSIEQTGRELTFDLVDQSGLRRGQLFVKNMSLAKPYLADEWRVTYVTGLVLIE